MDVVAIHIDSTDMQFHNSPSNRIVSGQTRYSWLASIGVYLKKLWTQFSTDFDDLGIKIFVFMCSFKNNNNKKLKWFKRVKNDQKTKFRTSIAFYPSFQVILVSKYLYWWVVYRKIIIKWKKDQKGKKLRAQYGC